MLDQFDLTKAATLIAAVLVGYYKESPVRGLFRLPPVDDGFLWWQTPVALHALNQYAVTTNDTQFGWVVAEVFDENVGQDHGRFAPAWGDIENDEKNDDTLWWTLSALLSRNGSYSQAAQKSFDHVKRFWANEQHCGCNGGIRWSADPSHPGWTYLNSVTNGQFMLASALLASGNLEASAFQTSYYRPAEMDGSAKPRSLTYKTIKITVNKEYYLQWAIKTFDWFLDTGLLFNSTYAVRDGMHEPWCSAHEASSTPEWSYNIALLYLATAVMYDNTGQQLWLQHHERLKERVLTYFTDHKGVLYEPVCRSFDCTGDDYRVFLGILANAMSEAYRIVPDARVRAVLSATASAMLRHCDGEWTCHAQAYAVPRTMTGQIVLNQKERRPGYIQDQIVALNFVTAALRTF